LDSLRIGACGLKTHPYAIVERQGIKFGIISFSPNNGTLTINYPDSAAAYIQELRPLCDVLIVSFHGGAEGRGHQHVTRDKEMFYDEDRGNVYEFAHAVIDAGADVVFGQGPHVPRALDLYKGKLIAYSLGNFCTYSRFSLSVENGYAPLLKVWTDRKGNFLKAKIFSYIQKGEGGPVPDPENHAFRTIEALTKQDIPEACLKFLKDGTVLPWKEE
jgi:hypothetical protein